MAVIREHGVKTIVTPPSEELKKAQARRQLPGYAIALNTCLAKGCMDKAWGYSLCIEHNFNAPEEIRQKMAQCCFTLAENPR